MLNEAKNFLSVAHPHVDIIKLGFGTSYVTPNLEEKLEVYRSYNIPVYFGGTLFEAFLIRNQFEDYIAVCKKYGVEYMEVSDGSIDIPHTEKCGYIEKLTKNGMVLSEVGSKDAAHIIPPYKWIELMRAELSAGVYLCYCRSKRRRKCRYLPRYRRSKRRIGSGNTNTNTGRKNYLGSTSKRTATYILLNCSDVM